MHAFRFMPFEQPAFAYLGQGRALRYLQHRCRPFPHIRLRMPISYPFQLFPLRRAHLGILPRRRQDTKRPE